MLHRVAYAQLWYQCHGVVSHRYWIESSLSAIFNLSGVLDSDAYLQQVSFSGGYFPSCSQDPLIFLGRVNVLDLPDLSLCPWLLHSRWIPHTCIRYLKRSLPHPSSEPLCVLYPILCVFCMLLFILYVFALHVHMFIIAAHGQIYM